MARTKLLARMTTGGRQPTSNKRQKLNEKAEKRKISVPRTPPRVCNCRGGTYVILQTPGYFRPHEYSLQRQQPPCNMHPVSLLPREKQQRTRTTQQNRICVEHCNRRRTGTEKKAGFRGTQHTPEQTAQTGGSCYTKRIQRFPKRARRQKGSRSDGDTSPPRRK